MRRLTSFIGDVRGAIAAEFALVLPLLIIFLLGIMDVGYYAWALNQGEKATQMGARWAVTTDMIPGGQIGCTGNQTPGLRCYSFAVDADPIVPQGTPVPSTSFPSFTCSKPDENSPLSCPCPSCPFSTAVDQSSRDSFDAIVSRMQDFKTTIQPDDVRIDYSWSGLGYSGDPNGPDVAPIVTVRLVNMQHRPLFGLLIGSVDLPDFAYSLTFEDGEGTYSN